MVNPVLSIIKKGRHVLQPKKTIFQGRYFYRLIWLVCISVCVPVVLASIVYYQFSINREVDQFYRHTESSLVLVKDRIEREMHRIELESLYLALDPLIKDSFTRVNYKKDMFHHLRMLDLLSLRKNAHGIIKDITYYHVEGKFALSNSYGFQNYKRLGLHMDIETWLNIDQEAQWTYLSDSEKKETIIHTRKIRTTTSGEPKGLLVFEVDAEAMKKYLIDTSFDSVQKSVFVVDRHDKIMFHSHESTLHGMRLHDDQALQKIRETSAVSSNFRMNTEQGSIFYSFLKTPFGIAYIASVPEKEISKQMNWIRLSSILVVFCLIGVGLLITYLVSKRAYNPIEQLVHYGQRLSDGRVTATGNDLSIIKDSLDYLRGETEKLSKHLNKIEPSLRESFLVRLANKEYLDHEMIYMESKAVGIPIDRVFVTIIIKLENFHKETRFLQEEKPIVTFAIKNIIQELMDQSKELKGYVFQTREGDGAILLHFNRSEEEERMVKWIRKYAESICEALEKYLSFTVSIGVGRFYPHIADVPVSYSEAMSALQHRLYQEEKSVFFIDDLELPDKQSMFFYPRQLEQAIINALAKDDLEQAAQSLEEFANALHAYKSVGIIYQSYCLLLSSIIYSLEQASGNILDMIEHNLFGQLQEKETYQEIHDWFMEEVFTLYAKLTEASRSSSSKSVIMQVCKHVKDNVYSDLSLIQCADLVGISPSYLSRLFKREAGVSFLDFVKEAKVEEAKRLLLETDENVRDIAEKIGYSERNLNRMFKQYVNMSPGQFRSTHR